MSDLAGNVVIVTGASSRSAKRPHADLMVLRRHPWSLLAAEHSPWRLSGELGGKPYVDMELTDRGAIHRLIDEGFR